MNDFFRLPDVLSQNERELALASFASKGSAANPRKWGNLVIVAYDALLVRVQLAELVVYRSKLLADDMESLIAREKSRGREQSAEGIANLAKLFVRDYVEPVLPPLRDALGFRDGDEAEGWYIQPEDTRAKILGSKRAAERLAREGRR